MVRARAGVVTARMSGSLMDSRDNEKVEPILPGIWRDICKREERIKHPRFLLK